MLRKIRHFLGRVKRRLMKKDPAQLEQEKQAREIEIIRQSEFFDEEYYAEENPDVIQAGADPLLHYYMHGWFEGRDPSENFSNDLYLKLNRNKMPQMNPIVHYETEGRNDPDIIGPGHRKFSGFRSASTVLREYFRNTVPFETIPVSREKRRLNIVFNGYDKSCFFGGKATALILAIQYVTRYGYDLRIIAQNPVRDLLGEFTELFSLEKPENVEYFATDFGIRLEISDKDDFLCTMWENAAAVLATPTITGNIYYIMQEVETFFYDHGDNHLKCYQTLTDPRLIPVVNSGLLHEYLLNNGYNNVREKGICFEPVFSSELLKPSESSFAEKDKHILFFYGRPSHQRNVFYFGLECLNDAFLSGKLNPNEWTVVLAGDSTVPKFEFDSDVEVKKLGVMSWKEYCDFVSTVDLCYSMIYTPHPSYPPLDTTTAGAVCVTNRFGNKQDLSRYSENIIMADLNKQSMLDALEKGAALAKNIEQRRANHANSRTAGTWVEAFKPVTEHMHKFVEDNK